MSRPKDIADVHAAKYDLRSCDGGATDAHREIYEKAVQAAARKYNTTVPQIEAAIAPDFGKWLRDERLPKLPSPPAQQS